MSVSLFISLDDCLISVLDPTLLLLEPRADRLTVTPQLRRKIQKYLCTAFGVTGAVANEHIPTSVSQWGRVRNTGGGDLIHARGYHKLRPDGRDASFVRVRSIVSSSFMLTNLLSSTSYLLTDLRIAEMLQKIWNSVRIMDS